MTKERDADKVTLKQTSSTEHIIGIKAHLWQKFRMCE